VDDKRLVSVGTSIANTISLEEEESENVPLSPLAAKKERTRRR
jgi:hypothetical protein